MEYTVDYFISKFRKIRSDRFCTYTYAEGKKRCGGGHCGMKHGLSVFPEEWVALKEIFDSLDLNRGSAASIVYINDGEGLEYPQKTPKKRLLAALNDYKTKELSEANLKEASKIVSENKIELV